MADLEHSAVRELLSDPPETADRIPFLLRTQFSLRSLLDVRDGVGCLAVRLSVVNLDLADAPGRVDRLLAQRRFEDTDRDECAVHRVPGPVR